MPRGRARSWTDHDLGAAVASSTSRTDVVRALGLRPAGGNHRTVRAHVARLGCDTARFANTRRLPSVVAGNAARRLPTASVFREGSVVNRTTLRRRAREHVRPLACALCGNAGVHCGRPLTLQLDHVNGEWDENRLDNLRWLCPNCHSQTASFSGRSCRTRTLASRRR